MKVLLSLLLVVFHISTWSQISYDKKIVTKDNLGLSELKLADIDGDSDKDFIFIKDGYLLMGRNINEKFSVADSITTNYLGLSDLNCLDLDQDGDTDIMAYSYTNKASYWWKNNGDLTFTRYTMINRAIKDFMIADMDNDGSNEMVMKYNEHLISYKLVNNTLQESGQILPIYDVYLGKMKPVKISPEALPGILVADAFDGILLIDQYEAGKFKKVSLIPQAISQNEVFSFDFDEDGAMDIFTLSYAYKTLRYFHNDGDNTFTEGSVPLIQGQVGDVIQGDYDGDGDQDFLVRQFKTITSSTLSVLNNKNTFFRREIIDGDITNLQLVGIEKINKDEAPDLCIYNLSKGIIQVYINNSSPLANDQVSELQVKLNPTVFQNEFQITSAGRFDYKIYNAGGNCITRGSAQDRISPDVSTWASGVYFVQLSADGKVKTVKVVKV